MFGNKINPEQVKKKNTRLLKELGINVIDHLPYIEPTIHRKAGEVAKRCVVLAALLQLHFGAPKEFVENYLADNDLKNSLTSEEDLLSKGYDNIEEQKQINLYWTIEAIWALTWVGKKHNSLSFNTGVKDSLASMLPNFQQNEPAKDFIDNFTIRSEKEIFIELDKFYRAHWFARNNRLTGKESPYADLDIIMERRKALEWVAHSGEEWDEISLDT